MPINSINYTSVNAIIRQIVVGFITKIPKENVLRIYKEIEKRTKATLACWGAEWKHEVIKSE